MKNVKKSVIGLVLMGLLSVFILNGCGEKAPDLDASKLIQQSIYNLEDVSSLRFASDLTAKITASGRESQLELSVNGGSSNVDPKKIGDEVSLVVKMDDPEYRFDVALKDTGGYFYIRLLDLPAIPNFPAESLADLVGVWWQIDTKQLKDLGTDLGGVSGLSDAVGTPSAQLDEEGKQSRQLILDSKFFKDIEFDKTEDINGKPAYKYDVVLDKVGLADYLKKVSEINGTKDASNDAKLDTLLKSMDFTGSVWVDKATSILVKIDGSITFPGADPAAMGLKDVELELAFSDLNQPFYIEAPQDYKVFDLSAFFKAFYAGLGAGVAN
jgi:hypothetical protein